MVYARIQSELRYTKRANRINNAETTMVYEELMKMENLNEKVCDMG